MPVESRILILRHQRVILDSDLAELYGVPVKQLNQQVSVTGTVSGGFHVPAHRQRRPNLEIANCDLKERPGGRRYPPYAFTEHGAIMAATVLNSKRAIEMSVFVVRAFVRMREMLVKNRQLAAKINELDRRLETHDTAIQDLIEAIKELMAPGGTVKTEDRLPASSRQDPIVDVTLTSHIPVTMGNWSKPHVTHLEQLYVQQCKDRMFPPGILLQSPASFLLTREALQRHKPYLRLCR